MSPDNEKASKKAKYPQFSSLKLLNRYYWLFRIKLAFIVAFLALYNLTALYRLLKPGFIENFWFFRQLNFTIPIHFTAALFLLSINYPYPDIFKPLIKDPTKRLNTFIKTTISLDLILISYLSLVAGRGNFFFSLNTYVLAILFGSLFFSCKISFRLALYFIGLFSITTIGEHTGVINSIHPLKLGFFEEILLMTGYSIILFGAAGTLMVLTAPMRTRAKELVRWGNTLEKRLRVVQLQVVNALLTTLAAKDPYTMKHSRNVAFYASLISKQIGLGHHEIQQIKQACKLHDIGKVGISEKILNKPGSLDAWEWEIIKMHTVIGAEILSTVGFLENVALMVQQEHERFDGGGYPKGLKGEEISLGAQIMAVADAFDVISSKRAYKEALSPEEAVKEIENNSGSQFSPEVVKAFKKVIETYAKRIKKFIKASETSKVDPRFMEPYLLTQKMIKQNLE